MVGKRHSETGGAQSDSCIQGGGEGKLASSLKIHALLDGTRFGSFREISISRCVSDSTRLLEFDFTRRSTDDG